MAETTINFGSKWIAVVTGGNKGIGFEISRQLASNGVGVVLTARDVRRGTQAVEKIKASGLFHVVFHQLDVTDPTSIASLAEFHKTQFGKLDILVNNAGVIGSIFLTDDKDKLTIGPEEDCLKTNYYGIKQLSQALLPLLQNANSARIVNVSSIMGQLRMIRNEKAKKELGDADSLTEEKVDKLVEDFLEDVKQDLIETKGWPPNLSAYIVSKAVLNAYTRILAKKYPEIAINAVSPGYTSTDMNNNSPGAIPVEQGAQGPLKLALLSETGITGLFFDQTELDTFE